MDYHSMTTASKIGQLKSPERDEVVKVGYLFSAAVLAGGRSVRMGTDKAFLRLSGEFLVERQLRCLLEAGAAELLISGRANADYSRFDVKVIHDEHSAAGPLAGLAAVLKAAAFQKVLVLAVDMPAMTSKMLVKLLTLGETNSGCVPTGDHKFQPLVAVYSKTLLPIAEAQLESGHYSMQEFVRQAIVKDLVRLLPVEPAEEICFTNWNQPSDCVDISS